MSLAPWNPEPLDVDLRIVAPFDGWWTIFDGWWTIERAEHDGNRWEEETGPNSARLCTSARLEPTTSVEGDVDELPALLTAIKAWQYDRRRRWAIEPDGDTALVWSPRNSEHSTRVTRRALEAMVAEYEARAGGAQ